MSKFLVKMLGPWTLLDGNAVIHCHRPTVAVDSTFLQSRKDSQVKYLAPLTDDATDEEFEKGYKDFESEAKAVEAFLLKYGVKVKPEETYEERKAREEKEAADLQAAVKSATTLVPAEAPAAPAPPASAPAPASKAVASTAKTTATASDTK